jgi:hypothetical protein
MLRRMLNKLLSLVKKENQLSVENSLGVEHASKEALVRALSDLHEVQAVESDITKEKYDDLGLSS